MKKALVITLVVGILMLAIGLAARPSYRLSQVVESDGQRQYEYQFLGYTVTTTVKQDAALQVTKPACRRLAALVKLPPSIDTAHPELAIRTLWDKKVGWYLNLHGNGRALDIASTLLAKNKHLKKSPSGPGFVDLDGTMPDGATLHVTIGHFSSAASPTSPVNCGFSISEPTP